MRLRIVSLALVAALLGTFALGAARAPAQDTTQKGGATGLVAAVAQLVLDDTIDLNDIDVVDVIDIGDITVVLNDVQIAVLTNVLNDNTDLLDWEPRLAEV